MTARTRPKLPFEVWALVAGGFTIALGYGVVAPVLPQFALEFNVSNFAATAVISSFALMRLIFAPAAGYVVSRLGERTTYVTGLLFVAIMTGVAVFVGEYWQLLASRALAGIGSTMFTIASTALMIKVTPPAERGRVAGINSAGFLLGNVLGPVLGALVAGWGIRAPFAVYFVTLVIAAFVVWVALGKSANVRMYGGGAEGQERTLGEALRTSQYRTVLFSMFAFGWTAFGVRVAAVPLFVAIVLGGPESHAGWALAAYAAGNAILVLPSGRWNDRIGRKPLLVIGFGVSAVAFFVFPLTTSIWYAMATLAIAGLAAALVNPAQHATVADVVGRRGGGQVVAMTQMSADLGAIGGPLIAGLLIDEVSFTSAFWVTAVLLALAAIAWVFTPDSRVLANDEAPDEQSPRVDVVSTTEPVPTGPITLPQQRSKKEY